MEKQRFRCRHCRRLRLKRVWDQKYCSEKACQQARRNAWRRNKYAEDLDYRHNQRASTATWLSSQGGAAAYYRRYRSRQKASVVAQERGSHEAKTGLRSKAARPVGGEIQPGLFRSPVNANRDASRGDLRLKSGNYMLCPAGANRDAFLVEIRLIPDS